MKEKILELVKSKPRHFSAMIKRDTELSQWVYEHSKIQSNNFAAMVYSACYELDNICSREKIKKFESFSKGFVGCGPANKCECVRQVVSQSVKEKKKTITKEKQLQINERRRKTNLQKYGVTNVAQTPENRQKFQEWYANPENVEQNLERIRKTNIERYGVENCKSLPEVEQKIIATCLAKYGVTNVAQIPSTKMKLRARMAEYKLTGHLIKKGYDRFSEYIQANYKFTLLTPKEDYLGYESKQILRFSCNECEEMIEKKFSYGVGLRCNSCNPVIKNYVSKEQQGIFDYITQNLNIVGYQSDRSLINPYEIDMVFSNEKIAIEYCGLYWHSENSAGKNKNYHAEKMKKVNEIGYRLITIFSDEWTKTPHIVKSKLTNIFGKTSKKHFARNLVVKQVTFKESRDFLNQYHLQGASSAKINLGLYTKENELTALMTFSNGRAALNNTNKNNEYELVRFVTNSDLVVGGASKLLKHFIKEYQPSQIISYADLRWSEGNLYKKLGFDVVSKPTIGYWYVSEYKKREHRFNFTKQQLVREGADPALTEWEIMKELGYDRIWDCGHQKFTMDLNK